MQNDLGISPAYSTPLDTNYAPTGVGAYHAPSLEDRAMWQHLFTMNTDHIEDRICDSHCRGIERLNLSATQYPDLDRLDRVLRRDTGWEILPIPHRLSNLAHYAALSERKTPVVTKMRPAALAGHTPEPDFFHDVFGHVVMLMNPFLAEILQTIGEWGVRAEAMGKGDRFISFFYYLIDQGCILTNHGRRGFGAALTSSFTECKHALTNPGVRHIPFDVARIMETPYNDTQLSDRYFDLTSYRQLADALRDDVLIHA